MVYMILSTSNGGLFLYYNQILIILKTFKEQNPKNSNKYPIIVTKYYCD